MNSKTDRSELNLKQCLHHHLRFNMNSKTDRSELNQKQCLHHHHHHYCENL